MIFRIKKYTKGFVVEVQKKKWYGKKYWTHFVPVGGVDSEPWYHCDYKYAEMNLINRIVWETKKNSKINQ